jgi:uncharacterized RDD family membrane protein YckC
MTTAAESLGAESAVQAAPEGGERFIGAATRAVSWILDAVVINLVAIITGVGAALVLSIFPLARNLQTPFEAIAGAVYVLWAALYFVVFWSVTGQTPGARVMQIRLVRADRGRVKPARALVRWIGMNLAMLPLFAGYLPTLFGRRPFPDWLAKTLVVEMPQLSLAEARRMTLQAQARSRWLTPSDSDPAGLGAEEPVPRAASVPPDGRRQAVRLRHPPAHELR